MEAIDLTGVRFGMLTVLARAGTDDRRRATWRCRCDCGAEAVVGGQALRRGHTKSCGCAKAAVFGPRGAASLADRHGTHVDRSGGPDACWPWTGPTDRKGYGRLSRGRRGEGMAAAHRVAWELAHGPIPGGLCVCHRCDNPPCCNPAHLFLGTIADNNQDMTEKGRHGVSDVRGEAHGNAKLTTEKVREIRARWAAGGVSQRGLAADYGVSQREVWDVIHGIAWAHVEAA